MQERVVEDASANPMNLQMHYFAGKCVRVTNAPSVDNLTCYNDIRRIFRNKQKLKRIDVLYLLQI